MISNDGYEKISLGELLKSELTIYTPFAEIEVGAFIAEHNLSLRLGVHWLIW